MTEHKVHRATVEYVSVVKFPYKKWRKCIGKCVSKKILSLAKWNVDVHNWANFC